MGAPPAREPRREIEASPPAGDGDFAEIFVNVGRREGARAADFQRLLTDRAGIDKADVRRIRVRERNAFVSVRRGELVKAINALTGATIAGKLAAAEPARERTGEGEGEGSAGLGDHGDEGFAVATPFDAPEAPRQLIDPPTQPMAVVPRRPALDAGSAARPSPTPRSAEPLTTPLTDFRGGGQAPIDVNAKATPAALSGEARAEHREETHVREKAESEDARGGIDEAPSTSKPS